MVLNKRHLLKAPAQAAFSSLSTGSLEVASFSIHWTMCSVVIFMGGGLSEGHVHVIYAAEVMRRGLPVLLLSVGAILNPHVILGGRCRHLPWQRHDRGHVRVGRFLRHVVGDVEEARLSDHGLNIEPRQLFLGELPTAPQI